MSSDPINLKIGIILGQLRHAYWNLTQQAKLLNGHMNPERQAEFAEGLIAPQIRRIEELAAILSEQEANHLPPLGDTDPHVRIEVARNYWRERAEKAEQSLETVKGERDHWKRIAEDWRNELVAEINKRFAALLRERPQEPS